MAVEWGVRALLLVGNILLTLTWISAWNVEFWAARLGLPSPLQLHIALGSVTT